MIELCFPAGTELVIEKIEMQNDNLDIYARRGAIMVSCPDCQIESNKPHSSYQRHPQDLPCLGHRTRLHITVRRFFCRNHDCPRQTFAEPFPQLLIKKARRTQRLKKQQLSIGLAVSGEEGRRVLTALGMPLSGDTLIREIRQAPEAESTTPRILGIDDWAMRKGQTYGTILVDLESQQAVDLLASREAEVVSTWLKTHPGVEIVTRDRSLEYAKAVKEGAPEAQQVADRWHLLKNLRESVEKMLSDKPSVLAVAGQMDDDNKSEKKDVEVIEAPTTAVNPESIDEAAASTSIKSPLTRAEQDKIARHAHKQARFELVKKLHQEGYSSRAIVRHLKISWRTVRKYIKADVCPLYTPGRVRPSKLTPWLPYLEERWQAGHTNATQLWREIQAQGFAGSRGLVARWAAVERTLLPPTTQYSRQQPREVRPKLTKQTRAVPWSSPRASWLLIKERASLDEQEKATLARMIAADVQVEVVAQLTERFVTMLKQKQSGELDQWLEDAVASRVPAFISFANGIRQDFSAVSHAISSIWSNGQVEGQVNRLKFIKRMMYGRANFDLLRKRVLHRLSAA